MNLRFDSTSKGVSPVIGVVLMVAITILLAGVIGAFFLDLTGEIPEDPEATVTFSEQYELVGANYEETDEINVQLQTVSRADSVWVEEITGQDLEYESEQIEQTNNDQDLGGSAAYGPSSEVGNGEQQYLLTRGEDPYKGGIRNIVTVDTEGSDQGTLVVIAENEGQAAVIQSYSYDNE